MRMALSADPDMAFWDAQLGRLGGRFPIFLAAIHGRCPACSSRGLGLNGRYEAAAG